MGYRSGIAVSCGVGCRCSSGPVLLWLWRRLVATALIRPLAWEPPYAMSVALKRQKKLVSHCYTPVPYVILNTNYRSSRHGAVVNESD